MESQDSKLERVLDRIFYGVGVNSLAQSQNATKLASAAKHQAPSVGLDPSYATVRRTREYLKAQLVSQMHKPKRTRFPRTSFISPNPNHLWICDCGYLTHLRQSKTQEGYFLLVEDLFSKRLWGRLLTRITSQQVANAFEDISEEAGVIPVRVGTDMGSEFMGAAFQTLMKRLKIRYYHSNDGRTKMSPVERAVKSVKSLLHRMLQGDPQRRSFMELFPIVIYSYNHRPHTSLPPSVSFPAAVNMENAKAVYNYMYTRKRRKMTAAGLARFRLNIGDVCRIAKDVGPLGKGYKPLHWSRECFRIVAREGSVPPRYRLEDYTGARVTGTFYFEELQRVPKSQSGGKPYEAKRVFGRRNQRGTGRAQLLVSLRGPEAEAKTAYWLDERLVSMPPSKSSKSRAKVKETPRSPPKQQEPITPELFALQRRSNRVRRAPKRMDL